MNDNPQRQTPAEQVRTYNRMGHDTFRRFFKSKHDADTVELLNHIKHMRHLLVLHGVNPADTDALLKKHGAI